MKRSEKSESIQPNEVREYRSQSTQKILARPCRIQETMRALYRSLSPRLCGGRGQGEGGFFCSRRLLFPLTPSPLPRSGGEGAIVFARAAMISNVTRTETTKEQNT